MVDDKRTIKGQSAYLAEHREWRFEFPFESGRGTSDLLQATLRLLDASRSLKSISSVNFRRRGSTTCPERASIDYKKDLSPRPIPLHGTRVPVSKACCCARIYRRL